MRRIPIPLLFALVIVVTATVYITVTPKTQDGVVYINVTEVPYNVTLPGFPRDMIVISFAPNVTEWGCVYIYFPGGILMDGFGGFMISNYTYVGCFTGNYTFAIQFNGTLPPDAYWRFNYKVIKPPQYVLISVQEFLWG